MPTSYAPVPVLVADPQAYEVPATAVVPTLPPNPLDQPERMAAKQVYGGDMHNTQDADASSSWYLGPS
jgi:hypothetical protein